MIIHSIDERNMEMLYRNYSVFVDGDERSETPSRLWSLFLRLVDPKDILITVPHDPKGHSFEVRVWLKKHGNVSRGHIDSTRNMYFEGGIEEKLKECKCCWPAQLSRVGFHLDWAPRGVWKKEAHEKDGIKFDVVRYVPVASEMPEE